MAAELKDLRGKLNMEKKNFDIRLIDYDNLNELTEMFSLCFGSPPPNYFEWKFLQNPAGKVAGFVAYHESEVAGFYGFIPEDFMVNGEKTTIYQSMDTMTHPKYQRQGLFTKLAKKTYEHLIEQDGEVFVIGFPGMNSYPGLMKTGWKEISWINFVFLNRTAFKVKTLLKKTSNISFEKILKFDGSFKSYFENKTYSTGKILRRFDVEFLNWRLSSNPAFGYKVVKINEGREVVGFFVYNVVEKKRCFIYHIDFAEDRLYEKYLAPICDYLFQESQSNSLYTFESSKPFLAETFRKNWFMKNTFGKGPFSYKVPFLGYSNREKIKDIDFFRKESYHIEPLLRDY